MDKIIIIAIVLIVFIVIIGVIYERVHEAKLIKDINRAILDKNYKVFNSLVDDPNTKKYVKPFNLDYAKLTVAFERGKDKDILDALSMFDNVGLTNIQKVAVYEQGFKYAILKEDEKLANKYYKLIKELKNSADTITLKDNSDRLYDILIAKGYKYLDEYLEMAIDANADELPVLESYIAQMYANKGDTINEEKYNKLVQQHANDLVQKELKNKKDAS